MKRFKWIVFILIIVAINFVIGFCFYSGGDKVFVVYKNVTAQHEIYKKVNSGMSYSELIKLLDDKKVDYSLKDNKLRIDSISFDISDSENVKLDESKMLEAFKKIDEKSPEAKIKVSYNKNGEKKEFISYNYIEYDGANYLCQSIVMMGVRIISIGLCIVFITIFFLV